MPDTPGRCSHRGQPRRGAGSPALWVATAARSTSPAARDSDTDFSPKGTIDETATQVSAAGGRGVAVHVDHR